MRNYPMYNGALPDRREIDPSIWRWKYIYINKNADKNAKRVESIKKSSLILTERKTKYDDICFKCYSKITQLVGTHIAGEYESFNIMNKIFDNVKSIESLRKKWQKAEEMLVDINSKLESFKDEMKILLADGIEKETVIISNDIVNAYDMQAFVKSHPEMFKKN